MKRTHRRILRDLLFLFLWHRMSQPIRQPSSTVHGFSLGGVYNRKRQIPGTATRQAVFSEEDSAFTQQEVTPSTHSTPATESPSITTPYQILYPNAFDDSVTGYDQFLSLHGVLKILVQALEQVVVSTGSTFVSHNTTIARIEHVVAHPVDPLGWLDAQTYNLEGDDHPLFYFANQEGDFETACIGSALTIRDTSDVWNKWWTDLPRHAQFYGGERFDANTTISEEWKDFGQAFWMLPSVELRTDHKGWTTVAVHLHARDGDWTYSGQSTLHLLRQLNDRVSAPVAPTTLPPVLSRDSNYGPQDGQELYEEAVAQALQQLQEGTLDKVVLARQQQMHFGVTNWSALNVIRRWKYGGHEGGHLFWMRTGRQSPEFFGCSPERLFQVRDGKVRSEALAGTRPRGSTQEADAELLRDLFASPKDRNENRLTGRYIEDVFDALAVQGWVKWEKPENEQNENNFLVRRLLHVQHICQRYSADLKSEQHVMDVTESLFNILHPTPAVCGVPLQESREFIQKYESVGFDRGFYSGPIGFIGRDSADIVVGIRSGLVTHSSEPPKTTVSVYAGAGVVSGSTLQGEWAEINYKLGVISSLFPQSPITLQGASTPNVAWATTFVEELIRNGITRFYVCPGSRSTPLVVAIAKTMRSNVGVVHAVSVHDERAAGFRALGYGRGADRPAAIVTSSGTAVANLYPSIVEAGMDGVPMLVLTADRPYENRDSGSNQAIDQVKIFSSGYVRWFRDILPPSDDVAVSVALSDAGHAVSLSRSMRGPVHVNMQFRENLAPDAGQIRNDDRVDSVTKFNGFRFTDVPGFRRWSQTGGQFTKVLSVAEDYDKAGSALEIAELIEGSNRGIIVIGNLRGPVDKAQSENQLQLMSTISEFAQTIGFPVFAGAQSAALRFSSLAVVPFAEHLLKCSIVADNIKPDLVIQIGTPLVSTEVPNAIVAALKDDPEANHVLLHPHFQHERADPNFTVTHKVLGEISPFLKAVLNVLETKTAFQKQGGSDLAPLVLLGRELQKAMKSIIRDAARKVLSDGEHQQLTEPEVVLALSEVFCEHGQDRSLFLSNSMPIRDSEFFLYPFSIQRKESRTRGPKRVGTNRGASGIDGIISSAMGFAESTEAPTTLLIGDLAALHDLNSLHSLANDLTGSKQPIGKKRHPLTTVIVNNDGGGIFSFLPIAKHGKDVSFDEFFGTPTRAFSFEKGVDAFGLPITATKDYASFREEYMKAISVGQHGVIEARVAGRDANVAVHREITNSVESYVREILKAPRHSALERLPVKMFSREGANEVFQSDDTKTLILLHGWMGDKHEWEESSAALIQSLPPNWTLVSVDLPGHGTAPLRKSSELQAVRGALGINDLNGSDLSVDAMALIVLSSLQEHYKVCRIDAVAGYSLGGRVALAMKRLGDSGEAPCLLTNDCKMVLLSASPGEILDESSIVLTSAEDDFRITKDDGIAAEIISNCNKACLQSLSDSTLRKTWDCFLDRWYTAPIWGSLSKNKSLYFNLKSKRSLALSRRGRDLAASLSQCSPPRNNKDSWKFCAPETTLFISGEQDSKYSKLGKTWNDIGGIHPVRVKDVGHAVLSEAPIEIAKIISEFLMSDAEVTYQGQRTIETSDRSSRVKEDIEPGYKCEEPPRVTVSLPKIQQNATKQVLHPVDIGLPLNVGRLDFEAFVIDLTNDKSEGKGVVGIGWGNKAEAKASNELTRRTGLLIQIESTDGFEVGVGEVSPLPGLHTETLEEAREQLIALRDRVGDSGNLTPSQICASDLLALDGRLKSAVDEFAALINVQELLASVRAGLETALLSLASQRVRTPIHQALATYSTEGRKQTSKGAMLPLNGLITRGMPSSYSQSQDRSFPSLKVKVGHQVATEDAIAISFAFQSTDLSHGRGGGKIRADANRAWNESQAIEFASSLEGLHLHAIDLIEFVEEPLAQLIDISSGDWSLALQVESLERLYMHTGIPYALDESIADLAVEHNYCFDSMKEDLAAVFAGKQRGCRAFVLKPALLGFELSMQLARLARKDLGIGAVVSSSFDSGVGLAYTSFLGALVNDIASSAPSYPHGVGTFALMQGDTLTPPFASYVNENGQLNVASLSRALYGLSLDELHEPSLTGDAAEESTLPETHETKDDTYEASTATSSSGKDISVVVSLPLPFSADIACSRFTDLPQQPRWSPWISSVSYQGKETEWTLNVRGIPLRWRATSQLVQEPWPGIQWESVSGLVNRGLVEFIPDTETACHMNVRMTIVSPRILQPLFQGTSVFLEDFLRDKLLKWSLEMFRDVVKADLAAERGDVELGDALIGAVEGKASAIEATLNLPPPTVNGDDNDDSNCGLDEWR